MAATSNDNNHNELVVSLTDSSVGTDRVRPSRVGGKASSLAKLFSTEGLGSKVPKAHALTVDFFAPWIAELTKTETFVALTETMTRMQPPSSTSSPAAFREEQTAAATKLCQTLQSSSLELSLSEEQSKAIEALSVALRGTLAAVRSSAPEEDGSGASFAGAFETKLAVETTQEGLEKAIKACFASLWDYRVLSYKKTQGHEDALDANSIGFCTVVMEMVDSVVAGVAFSANPLNSDRDEIVIDSSWGLGESVVDGSVTADRYVVDKLFREKKKSTVLDRVLCNNVSGENSFLLEETVGRKGSEKRLANEPGGGVVTKTIEENDPRYSRSSLTPNQIEELSRLVVLVEKTYGMPMDVEWAFVEEDGADSQLQPKLLQARPITTLFDIDPEMMTEPGEKRRLYFDFNVISEATTTTPFTTMDMDAYCMLANTMMYGLPLGEAEKRGLIIINTNPDSILYRGMTRQYANWGWFMKFMSPESMSEKLEMVDSYLASIVGSKDCDREKYKTDYWMPRGLSVSNLWAIGRFAYATTNAKAYTEDPKGAFEAYRAQLGADTKEMDKRTEELTDKNDVGLTEFSEKLFDAMKLSFREELTMIQGCAMGYFNQLDEKRRNGETEQIKEEHEALLGGYEGDELMEMNIALYRLAQLMPETIWKEHSGRDGIAALAERIRAERDLPADFLGEWKSFMESYGFDGQDQLFIGCPRYRDSPERLVEKLRLNATGHVKDPSVVAKEMLAKRRAVMAKQEAEARKEAEKASFWNKRSAERKVAEIQQRNLVLDHIMRVRNAPKIHLTKVVGAMRIKAMKIEEKFVAQGRLEETGDIFHLNLKEVDLALTSPDLDLKTIVEPRKAFYQRAVASNTCPLLVDSRCRILKPDPPPASDDPGTLVGAAISPGVATGKVRIIRDLSADQTRGFGIGPGGEPENHVLCAVVTGSAWTPLFASASAVVLQIGGALQHGALCAREYGKPAVSNIDVCSLLEDGMTVSVDGNTGIVKILDDGGSDEK